MYPGEYTFLFGLGMTFAFLDSYGIGANDVSNSFSAAVGFALNLKQAVFIASVCEFLGAFFMGNSLLSRQLSCLLFNAKERLNDIRSNDS